MHKIITNEAIGQSLESIPKNIKQGQVLAGEWGTTHTVATMVFDNINPKAEAHDQAFDVFMVIKGTGKFTLGGQLLEPVATGPDEWVAEAIVGGEVVSVGPGDIIDIPPGIPHRVDALGERLETVIVKIKF